MLHFKLPLSAHSPHMNASHFSHDLAPYAGPMLLHAYTHYGTKLCHYLTLSHRLPTQLSHSLTRLCATLAHYYASPLHASTPGARVPMHPRTSEMSHAFRTHALMPMPWRTLAAAPQPTLQTCLAFVLNPKHTHVAATTWHKATSQDSRPS